MKMTNKSTKLLLDIKLTTPSQDAVSKRRFSVLNMPTFTQSKIFIIFTLYSNSCYYQYFLGVTRY